MKCSKCKQPMKEWQTKMVRHSTIVDLYSFSCRICDLTIINIDKSTFDGMIVFGNLEIFEGVKE